MSTRKIEVSLLTGNQPLGSMVSILGANYVSRGSNPTNVVWGGDLMVGNSSDPSHLQVQKLWVRVVVSLIIVQMYPTPYQIRVQVGRDNDHTCESLFFSFSFFFLYI
jgi:hypothetical protein